MNNVMKRAAILIALAAIAELSSYLYGKLELIGVDDEMKELVQHG